MTDGKGSIRVRDRKVILIHWFNVACWALLLASGFGIISGDHVRLVPALWPTLVQNALGGNTAVVMLHGALGMAWAVVLLLFALVNLRSVTLPFLRAVLVLTPAAAARDLRFTVVTLARLFGLARNVVLPPQGRYNGAQRLLGTMIVGGSALIAVSGAWLFLAPKLLSFAADPLYGALFRWALVAHAGAVFLVLIGLFAHIYFALVEEPESLESMKSGHLPVDFIRHHNPLWHEELRRIGKL
jgi:formate dehydrogenase subunit gamma